MALAPRKRTTQTALSRSAARAVEALEQRTLFASVLSFGIYNADTDKLMASVRPGATVDLSALAIQNVNVVANVESTTASVRLTLDGVSLVDNARPFSWAPVNGTDYTGFTLAAGTHTLTVTPYSATGATGTAGTTQTLTLTSKASSPTPTPTPTPTTPTPTPTTPTPTPTVNQAPSVSLANTATPMYAPATAQLVATATDTDGTIARVDFYKGTTKIGTDSSAPYTLSVANLATGTYTYNAQAVDNKGATGTSSPLQVVVTTKPANKAPTVKLTDVSTSHYAPATVLLQADAVDSDGTVSRVDFYNGSTKVGSDSTAPYTFSISSVKAGSYTYTAKAVDNSNATSTSAALKVAVTAPPPNKAPTVTLADVSTSHYAPATLQLQASPVDTDGTIARVDFYLGTTKVGSDTTAPYTYSTANVKVGTYKYTARAYDNAGAQGVSAVLTVAVTVAPPNLPPTVTLSNTATSNYAPATAQLLANAADSDGSVARVEFYNGSIKLGEDTTAPYTYSVPNLATGTYSFTAKAFDNLGANTTSTAVSYVVTDPPANRVPTVTLSNTAPTTTAPASAELLADANDADGSIALVEFYSGGVKIGQDDTAPYTLSIPGLTVGTYSYTATATDNLGAVGASTLLQVVITPPPPAAPVVSLVNPTAGTYAGAGMFLARADASDADGTVTKVDFYANGQLFGSADTEPFVASWLNVRAGTYNVTAVATDNDGKKTTSAGSTVTITNPTGGNIYVVDPTGNDTNSGSADAPVATINRAASLARAGDTVLINPGTYYESLTLTRNGTADKPITFKAAQPGTVVVDGTNPTTGIEAISLFVPASDTAGDFIWVSGITFQNAANANGGDKAAVRTGDGWRMTDVIIQSVNGNGLGVFGRNTVVQRVISQNNGVSGISGSSIKNGLILDSISRNNDSLVNTTEGSGGKITRADGLLVDNLESYGNTGPGFWLDINNINVVIRNSAFHDNITLLKPDGSDLITGRGLFLEISGVVAASDGSGVATNHGAILVENNLSYDNGSAGITVYATSYAHLRGNTLVNNSLELKDKRPAPYINQYLTIDHNFFKNARITADSGSVTNMATRFYAFDYNTFDNPDGRLYKWNGTTYSSISSVFAGLGFEEHGKLGTVIFTPRASS